MYFLIMKLVFLNDESKESWRVEIIILDLCVVMLNRVKFNCNYYRIFIVLIIIVFEDDLEK